MAKIVSAFAVPHTPSFIAEECGKAPYTGGVELFAKFKELFDRNRPDVLVMIQNDHFNTFFLNNWPTFAIGIASNASGPSDQTPEMPRYHVSIERDLSQKILQTCVTSGFDFSTSQDLTVDHAILVPLHFLTPDMDIPIVPVFINCLVPPFPSAQRCFDLGRTIRSAVENWGDGIRVGILASGSLSLEVGGPKMEPNKTFGVPDKKWASWILDRVRAVGHIDLVSAATERRMLEAGNVGGELLNWITLLGAVGSYPPGTLFEQSDLGNAFAAWSFDGIVQ